MSPDKTADCQSHLLVVDDDTQVLLAIESLLRKAGFEVTAAEGGKKALKLLETETFDLILTDIRMPDLSGTALLNHIRKTNRVPVILMTGFANISETKDAYEQGACHFIAKPFKKTELLEAVESCLKAVRESSTETSILGPSSEDENYCKLAINDFALGKEIHFDIFIRLSEGHFIKIAHQGENIAIERIHAYRKKGIFFLYMRKSDFSNYMGFHLSLTQGGKKTGNSLKEKRKQLLKNAHSWITDSIFIKGVDQDAFESARASIESTLELLTEQEDLFRLLYSLRKHAEFLLVHSIGVGIYSAMIAKSIKWITPTMQFQASVGGLLHDLGKKEIEPAILAKPRLDLTAQERRLVESHPVRGMEILGSIPFISTDILQIVHQHHENCVGVGFPSGLKKNKIHPLARLVSVANEFCNLTIPSPHATIIPGPAAVARLCTTYAEIHDPEFLRALAQLFRVHSD